jgi:glucan endo-1,3-beta-D-glucosidase
LHFASSASPSRTYNMKRLLLHLLFSPCLAQAAGKIHTGFNYGAFWAIESNVKTKADFLDGFGLAKNLSTDTPFDSARLFTCKQAGTLNDPSEAFDAAVVSKTNLLLGFWISPAQKGGSPDENVKNEMAALEKAFHKHGQALSDLVIGLSVGNEDIYRNEDAPGEIGVPANVVAQTIDQVKKSVAASLFAKYMKDKPIGHTDTAKWAVVDNADFIGMTAYPYWAKDSVDNAAVSFQSSLDDVTKRAGGRPVWIAEMGWPVADRTPQAKDHGAAVPGADELQKFWTKVGCSVIGKYTTFWFQLLNDSDESKQPDWGFVDIPTRQPRVKNLSCAAPNQSPPAAPPASSQIPPQAAPSIPASVASSAMIPSQIPAPVLSSALAPPVVVSSMPAYSPSLVELTVFLTSTTLVTAQPSAIEKASTPTNTVVQAASPPMGKAKSTVTVTVTSYTTIMPTLAVSPTGPVVQTASPPSEHRKSTVTTNITVYTTITPTPAVPAPPASGGVQPLDVTVTSTAVVHAKPPVPGSTQALAQPGWCAIFADTQKDGKLEVVGVEPADAAGKCPSPPPYSRGYPQTLTASAAPLAMASSVLRVPATYTPASSLTFVLISSAAPPPPVASAAPPPAVSAAPPPASSKSDSSLAPPC